MNRSLKSVITIVVFSWISMTYGQDNTFNFKRELKGIEDQWHSISLSNELLEKTYNNLDGIRIMGVTPDNDTIKVPYLLKLSKGFSNYQTYSFDILNESQNAEGSYFTFKLTNAESINKIRLNFEEDNFDWRIKLEGSLDQKQWKTVLDNYRILSIENAQTTFKHTTLNFPLSNFAYYRLLIKNEQNVNLKTTSILKNVLEKGVFNSFKIEEFVTSEDKTNNQTALNIKLSSPSRVSAIQVNVAESTDFYRSFRLKYLSDSIKTEKGWKYRYSPLTSGVLTSVEPNEFQFTSTRAKDLKLIIENHDNQPLDISSVEVKGYQHQLVARFDKRAKYFMLYGNANASKPNYDIERFKDNIPKQLVNLQLGNEQIIESEAIETAEPLFTNKIWLWVLMVVVMLLLGGFTLKMMKQEKP